MYATNWAQLFLIIAATCALPSLVVGYVGVLRPALARGKGRQMPGNARRYEGEDGSREYGARIIRD
ncbi:MAG: hypothetical protein ROO76_05600 [Terriglobia bacterium]|nr:hypothetical protein [Terriglobia bacterium]